MATLSSLSSSTSSSVYGSQSKGIGGIATGLDTDSLIEQMTSSTRAKIAKQLQNKTSLTWKTESYRSVSSKLIEFANKYTSYTSSTNLLSESFFNSSSLTTSGTNSKYVSVSGSLASGSNISINGVKQLASNASLTSNTSVSSSTITTGEINFDEIKSSNIVDKTFTVKFGDERIVVTMPENPDGGVYETAEDVAKGMNAALAKATTSSGTKLSDLMKVDTDNNGKLTFTNIDDSSTSGTSLQILGGNTKLLSAIGLDGVSASNPINITSKGTTVTAQNSVKQSELNTSSTFAEAMHNKVISFTYNGTTKNITLSDKEQLGDKDSFTAYLQKELNTAFGTGRISVEEENGSLSFATTLTTIDPATGKNAIDTSSTLQLTASSSGIFGKSGILGIESGTSNRLNLNESLEKSNLANLSSNLSDYADDDGNLYLEINGVKIEGLTTSSTMNDIMSAINKSDAGVTMSYLQTADKFVLASSESGASGKVDFNISAGVDGKSNFATALFGEEGTNYTKNEGKDAIVLIDYDGEGGADPLEITRSTNSFTLDGLNISVNGTFGYDESGNKIAGTEAVKVESKVNSEPIITAVKSMIEEYNTMIADFNAALKEKPDRDYAPLTDEQKAEMSESEIANWEKEAKKGLLFGDSDLRNLTSELRFVFLDARTDGISLSDMGISVSTDYSDNGKITFDESKFKAALESNPDSVKKVFMDESNGTDYSGGIMTKMKALTDKYASTTGSTKGIFVEKAGHSSSPSSMLSNTLLKQMDSIDEYVTRLKATLKSEQTRYQNQFTALEQLTQTMNSQSEWLAQQFAT